MSDEVKDPKQEQEEEQALHARLTERAVQLVDKAYTDIADQLRPDMEAWLERVRNEVGRLNAAGITNTTDDLQVNLDGAVLVAMMAVTQALLRRMPPQRALLFVATAAALSRRLVPAKRAGDDTAPGGLVFPQSGTGKA